MRISGQSFTIYQLFLLFLFSQQGFGFSNGEIFSQTYHFDPILIITETKVQFDPCPEGSISPDSSDTPLLDTALQVLKISGEANRFWPSYWSDLQSFILTDPEKTVLLVTQRPPPIPYKPLCGDGVPNRLKGISYVVRGEIPDLHASRGRFDLNYVVGKDTLTAVSIQKTLPGTIEFFFHEAFHAFQHRVFPERDQVESATREIYRSENYQEYDSIERKLLSEIISLPPGKKSRNLLRAYITVRHHRLLNISENARDAEREIERTEGAAQLVSEYSGLYLTSTEEDDTLGERIQLLLQSNYENALNEQFRYRNRLYGTGAALSYILDLYGVNWQEQLLEGVFLDQILQSGLNLNTIENQDELNRIIESLRE